MLKSSIYYLMRYKVATRHHDLRLVDCFKPLHKQHQMGAGCCKAEQLDFASEGNASMLNWAILTPSVELCHFNLLRSVGKGAFGKVLSRLYCFIMLTKYYQQQRTYYSSI